MKFEYEGIIKKKKKTKERGRRLCAFIFLQRITAWLLLSLNISSTACWGQMLGGLGYWCLRLHWKMKWILDSALGSLFQVSLLEQELDQRVPSHLNYPGIVQITSDVKWHRTRSVKTIHFNCPALACPLQIPKTDSAKQILPVGSNSPRVKCSLGLSGTCTHPGSFSLDFFSSQWLVICPLVSFSFIFLAHYKDIRLCAVH